MIETSNLIAVKNVLNERIDYHRKLMKEAGKCGDLEETLSQLGIIRELEWIKKDLGLDLKRN